MMVVQIQMRMCSTEASTRRQYHCVLPQSQLRKHGHKFGWTESREESEKSQEQRDVQKETGVAAKGIDTARAWGDGLGNRPASAACAVDGPTGAHISWTSGIATLSWGKKESLKTREFRATLR